MFFHIIVIIIMATIEKFTSLSGRSMCVLRPQTYDHDMLIAFCVMKGADFEEESDEENGHHNDDEEAEEVPEQGGILGFYCKGILID